MPQARKELSPTLDNADDSQDEASSTEGIEHSERSWKSWVFWLVQGSVGWVMLERLSLPLILNPSKQ